MKLKNIPHHHYHYGDYHIKIVIKCKLEVDQSQIVNHSCTNTGYTKTHLAQHAIIQKELMLW